MSHKSTNRHEDTTLILNDRLSCEVYKDLPVGMCLGSHRSYLWDDHENLGLHPFQPKQKNNHWYIKCWMVYTYIYLIMIMMIILWQIMKVSLEGHTFITTTTTITTTSTTTLLLYY